MSSLDISISRLPVTQNLTLSKNVGWEIISSDITNSVVNPNFPQIYMLIKSYILLYLAKNYWKKAHEFKVCFSHKVLPKTQWTLQTYCTKITTGNIIIWTKKKVDSYGCDCLDGVVLFCDPVLGAVAGPLATGVGVCAGTRRGKCLMFTLIPSSMTSRTPVWQGVPFLSKIIFTFKLWLFTITTKSRKQWRYLGWYNWYQRQMEILPLSFSCLCNKSTQ